VDPVENAFRCKQCRDNGMTGVGYNKIIHRAASVAYIVSFLCSLVRNIVTQTELVFYASPNLVENCVEQLHYYLLLRSRTGRVSLKL
jgi:hypothetical protein